MTVAAANRARALAMLPNLGGLSLREAAPTAGCHDDATSDEDQAPCPSECHKKNEYAADGSVLREDENYKCYEPCGPDRRPAEPEPERPLELVPPEPEPEPLAPPAALAAPMRSATAATGAPASLTRFADQPTSDDDDAVSPDVVIGWFAEAARSMQPIILDALKVAPGAVRPVQEELEQLRQEAAAARAAAQTTLDEDWEAKEVALPRADGKTEMVEVRLLEAERVLVDVKAAMQTKTRWVRPSASVVADWLPLATKDDARGGFYTDVEDMRRGRRRLAEQLQAFENAFPYLIAVGMQEAGVYQADPANWNNRLRDIKSGDYKYDGPNGIDGAKAAFKVEQPRARALTENERDYKKSICVDAVREIRSIIDKHDYNYQGVQRHGKDQVEGELTREHVQTYDRIRQHNDELVKKGEAKEGERYTASSSGTFAELVRSITATGRAMPRHWPLAVVRGVVAWAKDEWLPARIAERENLEAYVRNARVLLDAAAQPYHDAVRTRERADQQLVDLAADEAKMDAAFVNARLTLTPLDKENFATLASVFHAFKPDHDPRTDGVRMLDASGAPPSAAHPPTKELMPFLERNAFDLVAVPESNNLRVHRVAGPRWMRDLRLQRVLHALLLDWWGPGATYQLNRTLDYKSSVHAVLKARENTAEALHACRAAALAIEVGARYARARLGARRLLTTKPIPAPAAAAAGVVLGWDVLALASPSAAAAAAAAAGAPPLLPWLADGAPFAAQQLDTAHHAMSYVFDALGGGASSEREPLLAPLPEGWAKRALAGYVGGDKHSRCAAIVVRAGEVGAGGVKPTSEVLEFGTLPGAAGSASVGGAIRLLQPTPAAAADGSVRGTYAHLFRKLHPEMLRLARHGPGSASARRAEGRYTELRETWAAEVLDNPEEAERRYKAYEELGNQLKSAETELALATTARFRAAKQQCDTDAADALRQEVVGSAVRAAMQREMAAAKRVSELLRERADLMLPSTAAEALGRERSEDADAAAADAADADAEPPAAAMPWEPAAAAAPPPPAAPQPRPRKRSALEEVVAAMQRHARRAQARADALRRKQSDGSFKGGTMMAGPNGETDVADAALDADSDASLFVVNPFLYKDPNAVVELARFRDDPLRAVCLASDNNGRVFLLIKDPEGTEHNASCRVKIDKGRTAPASFPRRLFVATPRGDPVQIPELVKIVFGDNAAARDPAGWATVQPDAQLAASSALPRPAEQGAEQSAPLVALARALVLCVALEARERDLFYPWLGGVTTAEPDQYMEVARASDYYGGEGYAVARDQASLTSSFAVGYGPGCALLAAASAHAAGGGDERLADLWG